MRESMSIPTSAAPQTDTARPLLIMAWGVVAALTVPQIILGAFMGQDVTWLVPARLLFLALLWVLAYVWTPLRPLRRMMLIFLAIYGVEGWLLGTVVQQSQGFINAFGGDANLAFFGERLLRVVASLVMLLLLLGMGLKPRAFFLRVGNLKAVAEPAKWGVPRKPETWPGFGGRFALILVTLLLVFMIPSAQPSLSNLSVGVVLFAALCAAMNAFAEEFLYRSALLPQVLPVFGKGASLSLVAGWFGLAHFFGVPFGITGVILTGIGGWIFAKGMVETGGMGWSLILHFISDFTIYLVMLLAGGF